MPCVCWDARPRARAILTRAQPDASSGAHAQSIDGSRPVREPTFLKPSSSTRQRRALRQAAAAATTCGDADGSAAVSALRWLS